MQVIKMRSIVVFYFVALAIPWSQDNSIQTSARADTIPAVVIFLLSGISVAHLTTCVLEGK